MKHFLNLLIVIFFIGLSSKAQEATAVLDHDEIKIGEQTTIDLEVRFQASSQVILPELKDTITKFINVIKVSGIDTTFDEDDIGIKIFRQNITITSFDSGYHTIPPFEFMINGQVVKTDPLLLTVNTIPIQAEQDIKDIKNIIEVPFSLWDWILKNARLLGLILLLIVLIALGIFLVLRLKNKKEEPGEVEVPKEKADVIALRKLESIEQGKLWQQGKVKLYYSELSFTVREYIENRFKLRALELTTDEIILLMEKVPEVDKILKEKLRSFLFTADMAKFAKQQPISGENEEAMKTAYLFVNKTAVKTAEPTTNPENTTENA